MKKSMLQERQIHTEECRPWCRTRAGQPHEDWTEYDQDHYTWDGVCSAVERHTTLSLEGTVLAYGEPVPASISPTMHQPAEGDDPAVFNLWWGDLPDVLDGIRMTLAEGRALALAILATCDDAEGVQR